MPIKLKHSKGLRLLQYLPLFTSKLLICLLKARHCLRITYDLSICAMGVVGGVALSFSFSLEMGQIKMFSRNYGIPFELISTTSKHR